MVEVITKPPNQSSAVSISCALSFSTLGLGSLLPLNLQPSRQVIPSRSRAPQMRPGGVFE